jgi:F-type H+-transporting ATPase subunit delta
MSNNGTLTTDSIDRVYATALLELAEVSGRLEEVSDEVSQLSELLRAEKALKRLLGSRALAMEERAALLERLLKGRVSDTLYGFVQVVNQKDRLSALASILQAFDELFAERRGIIEVDVTSAHALSESEAGALGKALGESMKKQVVLHRYVDEQLIGGLVIRVGDQLFDGSVATQLKLMKRKFVEIGREKARQLTAVAE